MDYSRPELAEKLAAEYVLGTLRGGARRRFETLLPAHPRMADAVQSWQQRMQPLAAQITPVEPPPRVWTALQQRLFGELAALPRWWQRLGLWQGFSGATSAAAIALLVTLTSRAPRPIRRRGAPRPSAPPSSWRPRACVPCSTRSSPTSRSWARSTR